MTRGITVAVLVLATLGLSGKAFALSFSADAPLQYTFQGKFLDANKAGTPKDRTVNTVSGMILGAGVGWFGVGYENYAVAATQKFVGLGPVPTVDFKLTFQLYDVFLALPFPWLHPEIGYGQGRVSADVKPVMGQKYLAQDADVSQYFLRLGVPIGHILDVHLGYHVLTAQDLDVPHGGAGPDKLKVSGQTLTAGVRLGF